jgi:hypothetical protein
MGDPQQCVVLLVAVVVLVVDPGLEVYTVPNRINL